MQKLMLFFSCVMLVCCAACQPMQRGIYAGAVVSSHNPAVQISAVSLPVKTAGFVAAQLDGTSAIAGLPVDVVLAVYGAQDNTSPIAIVAHATVPEAWQWDHDSTPPFSENRGVALIGGMGFQACTYIVEGTRDAFAYLAGEDGKNMRWLVRRFYARSAFGREKITLEYREPLKPTEKALRVFDLPLSVGVSSFEKRAEAAFVCNAYTSVRLDARQGVQGVAVQYLGKNFLGGASYHELWQMPRR